MQSKKLFTILLYKIFNFFPRKTSYSTPRNAQKNQNVQVWISSRSRKNGNHFPKQREPKTQASGGVGGSQSGRPRPQSTFLASRAARSNWALMSLASWVFFKMTGCSTESAAFWVFFKMASCSRKERSNPPFWKIPRWPWGRGRAFLGRPPFWMRSLATGQTERTDKEADWGRGYGHPFLNSTSIRHNIHWFCSPGMEPVSYWSISTM